MVNIVNLFTLADVVIHSLLDIRYRRRTGIQRFSKGLPLTMGEAHNTQISRRSRARLHEVLARRFGVLGNHSPQSTRFD